MTMPRILLVNYEFPPIGGGAGTATAGMARALAAMGCEVLVLTSRFGNQPRVERTDGFTVRRVAVLRRRADRCTPFEMLTFIASATYSGVRLARGWRPDLTISFFGIPGGPVGWALRTLYGVPYIVSLRGGDVPGFNWAPGTSIYHRITAPAIRFLWRRATAVVANGTGLQELARRALPSIAVPLVPNGVDADRHAPCDSVRKASAAGPPRLLIVGRLVHQKGIDLLLRALGTIAHVPFTLEIVGDGPERAALGALAAQAGIQERVHFSGWVSRERIAERYRAADVFVFPSRIEGMPNVVLEAMAYALPIVATAVPGNRELIRHDHSGVLIEPEAVEQLATALERVLRDAELRARLGAAARAHVVACHSWHASAAAYLKLGGLEPPAASAQPETGVAQLAQELS